jgi:hypothetical protein
VYRERGDFLFCVSPLNTNEEAKRKKSWENSHFNVFFIFVMYRKLIKCEKLSLHTSLNDNKRQRGGEIWRELKRKNSENKTKL